MDLRLSAFGFLSGTLRFIGLYRRSSYRTLLRLSQVFANWRIRWAAKRDALRSLQREDFITYGRSNWRPITLLIVSAMLTIFYLAGRPFIIWDDSDPLSYFRKAWAILGRPGGIDLSFRGPGYPIFLIITGAASLDTWWVLVPVQILMATTMPILIYAALAPATRNGAFIAGFLFISFGVAYNHMMWIMSEELYLFVLFLILALIARYFCDKARGPHIKLIAALCAFLVMVRPSGSVFFITFLFACLVFRVGPWRRYLIPIAIYVGMVSTWGIYDFYHGSGRFPAGYSPSGQAQRHFADVYYGGYEYLQFTGAPHLTVSPTDGPASADLFEAVKKFVASKRGHWSYDDAAMIHQLFERFDSDDALVRQIFTNPNFVYFGVVLQAAGAAGGDKLLSRVAAEHGETGLLALGKYLLRNPQIALTGAPQSYVGRMILANFYRYPEMSSSHYFFVGDLSKNLVTDDAGPKTKELLASVQFMIDNFPKNTLDDGNGYRTIFGSAEKMKEYIRNPYVWKLPDGRSVLGMIEGSVYIYSSSFYGDLKTDILMRGAAFEIMRKTPSSVFVFFDTFLRVAMLRHFQLEYSSIQSFEDIWEMVRYGPWPAGKDMRSTALPTSLAKYLTVDTLQRDWINGILFAQYYWFWRLLKIVFFFGALLFTIPLLMIERTRHFTSFLMLAYFGNVAALTLVLGNFDLPRYEDLFLFFPVMITVLGFSLIHDFAKASSGTSVRAPVS